MLVEVGVLVGTGVLVDVGVGVFVGSGVGVLVGNSVGVLVGSGVGVLVGSGVGVFVDVGVLVGVLVGFGVGVSVGAAVGVLVGGGVGVAVGAGVFVGGIDVGATEGSTVGAGVAAREILLLKRTGTNEAAKLSPARTILAEYCLLPFPTRILLISIRFMCASGFVRVIITQAHVREFARIAGSRLISCGTRSIRSIAVTHASAACLFRNQCFLVVTRSCTICSALTSIKCPVFALRIGGNF